MSLLKWALILGILAVVAGLLGFSGLAEGLGDVAKFLFMLFAAGVVILLILGAFVFKQVT